jgi:predicted AlkP superfamily phosphohydrolase/phosphomutase
MGAAPGVRERISMPPAVPRVLFLGLDGATATALAPLFDRGVLPNLRALWRRAAHGTLRSTTPMVTPVAWTSFLTGCSPVRHGIHEFYHLDAASQTICPNHADRIRAATLWQILSGHGRAVVSLNLPMTYPTLGVEGLVVAGTDAPSLDAAFAQCPEFGRQVRARLPAYTNKNLWKSRPRTLEELRGVAARTRALFLDQARAALLADERVDWSALLVHFHNLDGMQHRVWPELDVDDAPKRPDPAWVREVESCLTALDDACGILLELAQKRGAAVVAVSDHGFGPCRAIVNVNGLLSEAGLQRTLSYGTRYRYRLSRLRDRFVRWRFRDRPGHVQRLPRSVTGEVGCDWKRTVAYAPYGQLSACVFLHPPGLAGSVAGRRLGKEIIEILREARNPETQAPLFADAFDTAESYGIDPRAAGIPDILAPSSDGFQAQAKWSPFDRTIVRPDPELPGTHWLLGVVAIDAPGVAPGNHLDADLQDVAPTALEMLGVAHSETFDGRVVREAFQGSEPAPARPQEKARMRRSRFPA